MKLLSLLPPCRQLCLPLCGGGGAVRCPWAQLEWWHSACGRRSCLRL